MKQSNIPGNIPGAATPAISRWGQ